MENDTDQSRAVDAVEPERDDAVPRDERMGTLIFAAVLTLFGIFWVYASLDLPKRQQTAYLTQGFLPITAGFLLAGLSALLFISTWLTKSRPPAELGREPLFQRRSELLALGAFAALLAYIIILPHIHYVISTFLLMVVGLILGGEPLRLRLLIMATVMTGLFFGLFIYGLQLPLPGSRYF